MVEQDQDCRDAMQKIALKLMRYSLYSTTQSLQVWSGCYINGKDSCWCLIVFDAEDPETIGFLEFLFRGMKTRIQPAKQDEVAAVLSDRLIVLRVFIQVVSCLLPLIWHCLMRRYLSDLCRRPCVCCLVLQRSVNRLKLNKSFGSIFCT